jgi:hypothetical protein
MLTGCMLVTRTRLLRGTGSYQTSVATGSLLGRQGSPRPVAIGLTSVLHVPPCGPYTASVSAVSPVGLHVRCMVPVAGIARVTSPASSLTLARATIARNAHSGTAGAGEVFNAGKVALQCGATLADVKVR